MEDLIKLFPASFINIVGFFVVIFLLKIAWTFAEKWGDQLYRAVRGNKEKRHESRNMPNGFERREENRSMEAAMTELINTLTEERHEMTEFIKSWKEYKGKIMDDLDEIKRKQDKNWNRLFNEELPSVRHS